LKTKNGTGYAQNYDVTVKWMAAALRGETLEVLGVKSGRIEEVFGFEAADIPVKAGRVDIMARDDAGDLFHIEEQRDLTRADMCRFAAYHFFEAAQWENVTDIILASGDVWVGKKEGGRVIRTKSGKYEPVVIDFSGRDGEERLEEIREEIRAGKFDRPLELLFLPLYGKKTGEARSMFAEKVLLFQKELYRAEKIPVTLLAATLVMSNKFIDRERLKAFWKEIKMLDIFEIAIDEGKALGKKEGIIEDRREMLIDALTERFRAVSERVSERIRSLQNPDVLRGLFRQSLRCESLKEFETLMDEVA
jgi:hypothetical protein